MPYPEEKLITVLRDGGVDFTSSLPCEKIRHLLAMLPGTFLHVPLTREEEGVGMSAGAALAGRRPAMFVQSSGIGNMVNALLSLTGFYELPLSIFISQRGIYREKIAAQVPMGTRLPGILRGAGIPFSVIASEKNFQVIVKRLADVYRRNRIHAFLLSPAIFEKSSCPSRPDIGSGMPGPAHPPGPAPTSMKRQPKLTRLDALSAIHPLLVESAVVCNLGWPSKELFALGHRPSQFYMLGSMGMVTPIGLGVSLAAEKKVVVIDGDGSILMNPGTLATVASCNPKHLTILAIDNGAYGSTGNQPTLTNTCVDLAEVARGFGIRDIVRVSTKKALVSAFKSPQKGPRFIHTLARAGNADVPPISLHHMENKKEFSGFLRNDN